MLENVDSVDDGGSVHTKRSDNDIYAEYRERAPPTALPQSHIYDMIIGTVYKKNESPLKWPSTTKDRFIYILLIPITHLQWLTIPNPMRENKENFYPLSLFMATLWIWIYSFVIVWFTYAVTMAYNLHFSILPMILYPFGIALRD